MKKGTWVSKDQKTWTLDDSARASNPGNFEVNPFRWVRHYPKWPLIWLCGLGSFVALAVLVHWSFWVFALLLLGMNWFYWQRVREHFRHGCANPAIIVSMEPTLIAVSTDLTKGRGQYPVIKIIEKELPAACGQFPQVGCRLAAVALYEVSADDKLPHWEDFDPRPIDCATGDLDVVRAVTGTFAKEDWDELRVWLRQVPRPYRCGLYHIRDSE